MATFRIPNQGNIRQLNRGDIFGELWATKNIDLATSPGKIKLALPSEQIIDASTLNNDKIEGITLFNSQMYALTDDDIYRSSNPYNSFSAVGGITLSTAQDIVIFNGLLRISENNDIARYNGGGSFADDWWTNDIAGTALTSSVPHIMHVARASGRDTIVVTDNNAVRYYNSDAGHARVSWDSGLIACSVSSGLNTVWVGTYNESGDKAEVYSFQIGNDQYTQAYPINGNAVLSIVVDNNIPIIINERGEIQRFNQAGFTTIATLPLWNTPEFLDGVETGLIQSSNTARPVHPKGMTIHGDKLLVYVNSDASTGSSNVNERTPSGVYEVDLITGSVSHRASANNESVLTQSSPIFTTNDPNGRIYFGGKRDPIDASEGEEGLWRENLTADAENYGYFITNEMHSDSVIDNYEQVVISALQDTNDSVVVKYRAKRSFSLPVESDVTWSDTNVFNTTTDLSAVSVGDEVEILIGVNSGRLTTVTAIESSASTYSVTVADSLGTTGNQIRVRFDNWVMIEDPYNTTELVKIIKLNQPGTVYQFKVYLSGKNGYPEITRMVVKTNNKQPL